MNDVNAVLLEHRLTEIESTVRVISSDTTAIKALQREQNGRVASHMESDAIWMAEHTASHAQGNGYWLAVIIVVANVAAAAVAKVFL